jgi:hypothetical protein
LTFSVCDADKLAFVSKANRAQDHTKKTRLASALLRCVMHDPNLFSDGDIIVCYGRGEAYRQTPRLHNPLN